MKLQVVASSSRGNCYILESGEQMLVMECGVPMKQIQQALGFDFSRVVGCTVTHSHQDHCKAIQDVMKAGINVYCSPGTAESLGIGGYRLKLVTALKQFTVGQFIVLPFPTEHDVEGSLGFLIYDTATAEKIVFLTDTFYSRYRFSGVNYILIECNHCLDILNANVEAGIVDVSLKNRLIRSHFGLGQVKEFLKVNVNTDTRKIVLLHLSDDNSDAGRMVREIKTLTGVETVIADPGLEIALNLFPF